MKVLIACEFSGVVRDAFLARGHDAISCDILPTEVPGPHHQGDVREILEDGWDLMIAHPPCTYLAQSGVQWLHKDPSRWAKMERAASFFLELWNAPIPHVAVENPRMHKYGLEQIGETRCSQIIQPWLFGHLEKKTTWLWLRGLPRLIPTSYLKEETDALPKAQQQRVYYISGANRQKRRSRFFPGIAAAMAKQWSDFCRKERIGKKLRK